MWRSAAAVGHAAAPVPGNRLIGTAANVPQQHEVFILILRAVRSLLIAVETWLKRHRVRGPDCWPLMSMACVTQDQKFGKKSPNDWPPSFGKLVDRSRSDSFRAGRRGLWISASRHRSLVAAWLCSCSRWHSCSAPVRREPGALGCMLGTRLIDPEGQRPDLRHRLICRKATVQAAIGLECRSRWVLPCGHAGCFSGGECSLISFLDYRAAWRHWHRPHTGGRPVACRRDSSDIARMRIGWVRVL